MIELLDFQLPTVDTPNLAVPVTAQPQALYLRTVAMTGTTPLNHMYDGWGFWTTGTLGVNQFAQGIYSGDAFASSPTISIGSAAHSLRLEDFAGSQLGVAVVAVSPTQITLNCTGALLSSGVRVIGFACSGFSDAWCGTRQLSLPYPMPFTAGFQPDFAAVTLLGSLTTDSSVSSTNSGTQSFGVMNTTSQSGLSLYTDTAQRNKTSAYASQLNLCGWMGRDILYEEFFGAFTVDGVAIDNRSGNDTVSSLQTMGVFCLQGSESTIETGVTTAGSAAHNFTHSPDGLVLFGSGNNLWETRQAHDVTTAWNQMSQALAVPGTPPTDGSVHTGTASDASANKHRNNEDGAMWGYLAGTTPTTATAQYRGKVTTFAGQAAQTDWTLNGTGVPTGAYPWVMAALGSAGAPDIPLNTAYVDAYVGDAVMELLPEAAGGGGFAPFGPGVFR